jgi:phospholipid/cholesterol/gamma-HCH transport system permease protein
MNRLLTLTGQYFLLMKRTFKKPEKWGIFFRQCISEADKLVINSIPLVALISVFIGAVLVIQTANNLENPLIPKMYIGYMTRESLILEFSSTMICLILAGKIGSNISSEIGSMRITEQIDAMDMMGVNSANYLILPKLTVTTLLNPLLMLMSFMLGLLGGYLIVAITGIISPDTFVTGIRFWFLDLYVIYSIIKTAVFSFIITSISCFYGYNASNGSLGVGRSSTKAIVVSSALILIFNLMLTKLIL